MAEDLQIPSDRQLIVATRAGSSAAWSELRTRHERAVTAVAAVRRPRGDVEATFERLHHDILRDDSVLDSTATGDAVRPFRPRALAAMTGGTYGPRPLPADEPHAAGLAGPAEFDDGPVVATTTEPRDPIGASVAELTILATAFGRLSEVRQTVLWHRLVDLEPAATVTAILGRTAAETVALEAAADAGLFEAYTAVELESSVAPTCRPIVALLGGYRRGTLPDAQRRVVDAHLASPDPGISPSTAPGCGSCRRRLALAEELSVVVPLALVPSLTGLTVERYRAAIGAAIGLMGTSALAAQRSARANRLARVGAAVAVIIALLGAAFLIRSPFDDLEGEIADLLERSTTATTIPPSNTSPPGGSGDPTALPSRVELVFLGAPQGVVYVPGGSSLDLGLSLSTPAPVYRNGTGTIDAAITNNSDASATVRFVVRASPGVSFDALVEGPGRCEATRDADAACVVDIDPGAVAPMSLRLALDSTVSDRLLVVPSIRSQVLDLPIETVPGLVIGAVARGELAVIGNTLGSCVPGVAGCPARGERNASSATLELASDATIDRAVLLWRGEGLESNWAGEVGLIVPGATTATPIAETGVSSDSAVDAGGEEAKDDPAGGQSGADVTDLVRAAGAGKYTVVRPPSVTARADGSWTLIVVTQEPGANRRLVVVVGPRRPATSSAPVSVVVPVESAAPAGAPRSPVRPTTLKIETLASADEAVVTVDGEPVIADRAVGDPRPLDTYALEIDSSADALAVEVSTSTRPVVVTVIGLAVDIVT